VAEPGLADDSGSSSEREPLREEPMPEGEEDRELWDGFGLELARLASSNESLGGWRPAY